jgi:ATP-dependent DNA helicase PIF1
MIDGVLFGALDEVGKNVRGNPGRAFGGLQLILSGDLYQLPPVSLRYAGFVFSSNAWNNGNIIVAELKTVVRQAGDMTFVRILRQLQEGRCSSEAEKLLANCHVSRKKNRLMGL